MYFFNQLISFAYPFVLLWPTGFWLAKTDFGDSVESVRRKILFPPNTAHCYWKYLTLLCLTSLYLFRTLALATLSYDDAHNIVTTCTNLKRLALDCDFYGRAIRHIISSLAPTLEVNMKTTKKSICFHEFFLEVVKK